jgi:DNA invertase Pin-like site-specific DNA recombinase
MRAALYARVSTEKDDRKGENGETVKRQDPEVQLIKLREFAHNREYKVVKEYTDRASGSNAYRPGFEEMMKAAFHREFDIILIVRLDRITRSLSNLLSIMEELQRAKVDLIATDQSIALDSPNGKLMVHLLGAFAEWEKEIIRERVKDGMDKAKARGTKSGKPIGRMPSFSTTQLERGCQMRRDHPEMS